MNDHILVDVMTFVGVMTFMVIVGRILSNVVNAVISRKSRPPENVQSIESRLARIEQIVEASAIEIERIGEGQRFTTKVLIERAGSSAPVPPEAGRNTLI